MNLLLSLSIFLRFCSFLCNFGIVTWRKIIELDGVGLNVSTVWHLLQSAALIVTLVHYSWHQLLLAIVIESVINHYLGNLLGIRSFCHFLIKQSLILKSSGTKTRKTAALCSLQIVH